MPNLTREELVKITDDAFALRMQGNEKLKAGDNAGALSAYHQVLLRLKGLDSQIQSAFGADPSQTGISRIASAAAAEGEAPAEPKEPSLQQKVKTAVGLVYLNSAAVHIKQNNFKRALECATSALHIDENNQKAKFREAQARIGLGEISRGRQMLEELQKKAPDVAITNALNQLKLDEKARTQKSQSQFKGMYTKKPTETAAEDKTSSSSTSTAMKLPPGLDIPPGIAGAGSTSSATITELDADAEAGAAAAKVDQVAGADATEQPTAAGSEVTAESLAQA